MLESLVALLPRHFTVRDLFTGANGIAVLGHDVADERHVVADIHSLIEALLNPLRRQRIAQHDALGSMRQVFDGCLCMRICSFVIRRGVSQIDVQVGAHVCPYAARFLPFPSHVESQLLDNLIVGLREQGILAYTSYHEQKLAHYIRFVLDVHYWKVVTSSEAPSDHDITITVPGDRVEGKHIRAEVPSNLGGHEHVFTFVSLVCSTTYGSAHYAP